MSAEEARDELDRSVELLWGVRPRPRKGPKPRLSVEQIVRSAIEVADAEGVDALTMSRIAKHLGSPLMSLYRYVPSKAELISIMLDTVIGPAPDLSGIPGGWRAKLETWARRSQRTFAAHPWALPLATTRRVMGPNELDWFEAALSAVSGIGLSENRMLEIVLLVNSYARGNAQTAAGAASTGAAGGSGDEVEGWGALHSRVLDQSGTRDRFPTVLRLIGTGTFDEPPDPDFGLQRVLDGIEAFLGSPQPS